MRSPVGTIDTEMSSSASNGAKPRPVHLPYPTADVATGGKKEKLMKECFNWSAGQLVGQKLTCKRDDSPPERMRYAEERRHFTWLSETNERVFHS